MTYHFPMFPRLEPRTPFQGGRIADTDVLNLTEAARFASVHAGAEITSGDFLRAAGRGEITMRAIVHRTAKLQRIGGGVYCNAGQPNENTAPNGSILNLPLSACEHLAATGRASWRKFDGFEQIDGQLMRYVIAELTPDEPDFETTSDDCRLTGNAVHALADEYRQAPAQDSATHVPLVQLKAQCRNVLAFPSSQTHVQFGELAHKIASALHPLDNSATDGEMMAYGGACINLEAELLQAVKSGALPVKDPLTFGPHSYPRGNALQTALVSVNDLRAFLAGRPISVESVPEQATTPNSAPVVEPPASEPKAKRRTLWDVVTPYIVEIMQAGQYASAKELFKALETKAGQGSPFDKGSSSNRYSLFVRDVCEPLALKTLQNNWQKLRTEAAKK